jgi:hypothetical protein
MVMGGRHEDTTASQLREEIDRGRTGDKVPVSDPAAAPLGTDDEAAGHPPGTQAVAEASRAEEAGPTAPKEGVRSRFHTGTWMWALCALFVLVAIVVTIISA